MHRSIIALTACVGLALAQNDTVQLFWPGAAGFQDPVITVQAVNASAIVLHIACPTSSGTFSCDWERGIDYTIFNSSTYEATMTGDTYMMTRTCEAKGQGGVNCFMEGNDERRTVVFAAQEHWVADATNTVIATVASGGDQLRAASTGAASISSPSPAAGSSATSAAQTTTASTVSLPQATGVANDNRAQSALVLLCAAAVLYA